jgi:hypothetical protein
LAGDEVELRFAMIATSLESYLHLQGGEGYNYTPLLKMYTNSYYLSLLCTCTVVVVVV